jgi:hypothetical protein
MPEKSQVVPITPVVSDIDLGENLQGGITPAEGGNRPAG